MLIKGLKMNITGAINKLIEYYSFGKCFTVSQ